MCNLGTQDHKGPKTEDHKRPPRNRLVHFKDGNREALTGYPKPHKARCKTGASALQSQLLEVQICLGKHVGDPSMAQPV